MIEPEEVAKRVKEIGDRINSDYRGQRPILVGVLKGAFMFLSDLLKEIDIPVEIDFLSIHSYNGTESSGKRRQRDLKGFLSNMSVLKSRTDLLLAMALIIIINIGI
ncbi:hypothetical protein BXT86_06745 [candidate division WOR-3 bacterium 4484_100]|uniref:Phosphoribosyltransferase domain-containing protein n=1 Tax=candidate division WOR-3 bacterium 4484_100 TaxID=1936077 RepID=A0A1V4QDE8_UNCW3|nr:MAG: hypothetical protein BXT86_06745 [candidate division WOR-3 bacterium 4484_100]